MNDAEATNLTHGRVEGGATIEPGTMRMAKVGERRVVVIRTASGGFHALDNACPHEGYGLATGALDGDVVTCQWHNWKFDVRSGVCTMGEEDVACHQVAVDDQDLVVTVQELTTAEQRDQLWPSLRRGLERNYPGQMARDVARLLQADASPEDIVAEAMRHTIERTEWGMGHEMAGTADLLALANQRTGLDRVLPLTHAMAGLAETTRDRPAHDGPAAVDVPHDRASFLAGIEDENWNHAVAALEGFRSRGGSVDEVRAWFIEAASQHHLGYGHGAIYTQKTFELIDQVPELTDLLLRELALTIVYATREDLLPYMRKTMREIEAVDLAALTEVSASAGQVTSDSALVDRLLTSEQTPVTALVEACLGGLGVPGIIDAVSLAGSRLLLDFDLAVEQDTTSGFRWLDITHVVTYANAARWAWSIAPGPDTARLALFTAFLANDAAGRGRKRDSWITNDTPAADSADATGPALTHATVSGAVDDAVALALGGDPDVVAGALEQASMDISGGSFIVAVHMVKLAVAARSEAAATGSQLPLAAAARFLASPRHARFVAFNADRAVGFVESGKPPPR